MKILQNNLHYFKPIINNNNTFSNENLYCCSLLHWERLFRFWCRKHLNQGEMRRKLEETEGDFYDMRLGFRKSSGNLLPDLIDKLEKFLRGVDVSQDNHIVV